MGNDKIVFVTGATGNQGGAVARNLHQKGFIVKALTRNTNSPKASILKQLGIQLVKGDLNNSTTYLEHLKGAYGVFSVQTFEEGVKKETRQGISLATTAKELSIQHFVYSSAPGADLKTGIPHIESKFVIENHIRQMSIPFTIIRPGSFYENFLIPQVKKGILKGHLTQPINRDTVLHYIAADDIGKAVARIFCESDLYNGKTVSLACESLSTQEVAETFTRALNREIVYKKLPTLITRLFLGKDLCKMFKWMDEQTLFIKENIKDARQEFPDQLSLKSWITMNFKTS